MMERVAVLDFGSQLTQLVARRTREVGVYSEVFPFNIDEDRLREFDPIGIILSGSSESTLALNSPSAPAWLWDFGVPVLGLCYGMQTMAVQLGGQTMHCSKAEFGYVEIDVLDQEGEESGGGGSRPHPLFKGVPKRTAVWMSHSDQVKSLPPDFICLATSQSCPYSSMAHKTKPFFGIQFHPETTQTCSGRDIFRNFLFEICKCKAPSWNIQTILHDLILNTRAQVAAHDGENGGGDILLGLSGGVDSSVVAALLHHAVGPRLKCIIIDTGLMRKNEVANVIKAFDTMILHEKHQGGEAGPEAAGLPAASPQDTSILAHCTTLKPSLFIEVVDASERFFKHLEGVSDPEEKRKIIGHQFVEVFNEVSSKFKNVSILAQGTIYPDVIESAHVGNASLIKTHHNVGGLPKDIRFKILEPLRHLFKDEVRALGQALGLPHDFVWRQPFPGPGLGVRVIGEITRPRVAKCQEADDIFMEEIQNAGLYHEVSQALAALIPVKAVAVKGDAREYDEMIALRAVKTEDFMTAQCFEFPTSLLRHISRRICNEVAGVTRVFYDYTDKPPATIEYE